MKKVPLTVAALMAIALVVPAVAAAGLTPFHTPSKRIYCAAFSDRDGTFLRCDTNYRIRPLGNKRCREGDWGSSVAMGRRDRSAGACVSDSVHDTRGKVVRYGHTYRFGPFTCTSRTSGLTCHNLAGHGWFLSKARQRLF